MKFGTDFPTRPPHRGRVCSALLSLAVMFFSFGSYAQERIVGYDFDDGTDTPTTAATASNANVTVTDYLVGAGLNSVISSNANSQTSTLDAEGISFGTVNGHTFGGAQGQFGFTDMGNNNNNLSLALANEDFMTFTVTPNAGVSLDFTKFTFVTRVNSVNNSAERFALFTSLGGFLAGDQIAIGQTTTVGNYEPNVINLGGPAFQDVTTATDFRLYIYGGNNVGNSATLFDKVSVFGDVTGPLLPFIAPQNPSAAPLAASVILLAPAAASPSEPLIVDVIDSGAISQLVGSAIPMNLAIGQAAPKVHNVSSRTLNHRVNRLRAKSEENSNRGSRRGGQREVSTMRVNQMMDALGVTSTIGSESDDVPITETFDPVDSPSGKSAVDSEIVAEGENWTLFASADYGFYELDPLEDTTGLESNTYASTVGAEYILNEHWGLGAGWSHVWNDNKLRNNLGGFDIEGNAAMTYLSYFNNNFWGDVLYSYGDYKVDTHRNTFLGSTVRANPDLESHLTSLNFGYNIPAGRRFVHGPTFRGDYSWGQLDGYTERGDRRANTIFREQDYQSLVTTLGWQINWKTETPCGIKLRPNLWAGYGRENLDQKTKASGSLEQSPFSRVNLDTGTVVGRGNSVTNSLSQVEPGEGWMEVGVGLGIDFTNRFGIYLDYQGRLFQDDAQLHLGTAKASWKW